METYYVTDMEYGDTMILKYVYFLSSWTLKKLYES